MARHRRRSRRVNREQKLSFHSLRHTSATLLKEAGIPDAAIRALIGLDSVAVSQHYTHVGREALVKAANALPEIEASEVKGSSLVGSEVFRNCEPTR